MFTYRFDSTDADARARVRELLDEWSRSEALRSLVDAEGGEWPTDGSLLDRLETLHAFSERWDFRRGGERLEIADDQLGVPAPTIEAAADELGLSHSGRPCSAHFDHVLVLGGTVLADYCRTKYVRELLDGGIRAQRIGSLGALREIPDAELEIARARAEITGGDGLVVATEFDALLDAAQRFLPPASSVERSSSNEENVHLRSANAIYTSQTGHDVEVIAAPSPDPERRATTIDNYHSYAQRIQPEESILVCTSAIYVPYHFFVAVRALALEKPLSLEIVGFPPEWMEGVLTGLRNYLQETRSALFGAVTLARELLADE